MLRFNDLHALAANKGFSRTEIPWCQPYISERTEDQPVEKGQWMRSYLYRNANSKKVFFPFARKCEKCKIQFSILHIQIAFCRLHKLIARMVVPLAMCHTIGSIPKANGKKCIPLVSGIDVEHVYCFSTVFSYIRSMWSSSRYLRKRLSHHRQRQSIDSLHSVRRLVGRSEPSS